MELGLKGKVALVTGSSKGIGLETALFFAKEGAEVTICARNRERLEEAASYILQETGKKVLIVETDVTNKGACQKVVSATVKEYGRLDILVNNAGTSQAHSFEDVGTDLWQQDLDLKLFGAIHCSQYAIPYMREADGGSIVNVTAVAGKTPSESSLPTSVSRSAGMALTKAMSKDLGPDNIRVNTVCIGLIRSEQIEKRWQDQDPTLSWEQFSQKERQIPLGRIGDTKEAAKVITFLSSEAASYVSGAAVNIDGGRAGVL
ncbi:SDR family NAD(P)-dependent oxidoreductase [Amphibacillus sp. Q70]|uniref:SDR family NAD(P)-dependent oxidoreductase n=1 Tax=Amphibacillus sp. Q70 TaxID=3453416 RepID=UPI003F869A9B